MPDVVEWSSGGTPKSDNQDYYNGNIPWLIIGDLTDTVVNSSVTHITELGLKESSAKYVEKGSVLLGMYGSIGKLGIAGMRLTTNQAIAFTKSLNGIHNWYLFYYLQHLKTKLYSLSKGGTQKNISLTVVNSLNIPIPPIFEQHRIVAKIDILFSEINNSVTLLKTMKIQIATYKQSLLKWAFELKNTKIVQLYEIAEIVGGITKGRNLEKYETIFLPYLSVANVQDGYLNLTNVKKIKLKFEEKHKYLLRLNDVLYTEGGDKDKLGRGTIWKNEIKECVHQNHIFRARIDEKKALPKYVALFSLTKSAKDYFFSKAKQTVNLASINMTVLRSLPIPLPNLNEQLAIVSAVESRLSVCDKLEQTIDQTLALSASLRQSILKRAFEGRLVPQDPNDEPAEKLLERIKAEKAAVLTKQKQIRKRGKR
jgi:type I restriction enzyme S subunit